MASSLRADPFDRTTLYELTCSVKIQDLEVQ